MQVHIEDTRPPRPEYGAVAPWGWYFGEFISNNPQTKRWTIYNSR